MTDRELLALAAKAWIGYGMQLERPDDVDGIYVCRDKLRNGHTWNPLTDDGDALRLAVKLKIVVDITPWAADAHHWHDKHSDDYGIRHSEFDDPCSATRRAIVRAAAASAQLEQPQ